MIPWLNFLIIRQISTIIVTLCVSKMIYKVGKDNKKIRLKYIMMFSR